MDKKIWVFEDYLPPKLSLDFVTKYAYFLQEIIFNNFLKKVLSSFVCFFN